MACCFGASDACFSGTRNLDLFLSFESESGAGVGLVSCTNSYNRHTIQMKQHKIYMIFMRLIKHFFVGKHTFSSTSSGELSETCA